MILSIYLRNRVLPSKKISTLSMPGNSIKICEFLYNLLVLKRREIYIVNGNIYEKRVYKGNLILIDMYYE